MAAAVILATYGAMYGLKIGIEPPVVVFPAWCHKDNDAKKELCINLPFQLGAWSGEKTELDPKIFDATEAKIAENRVYSDDSGHTLSLHIAYYDNVDAGVWHCPTNCYRCSGWQCSKEAEIPLAVEGSNAPKVYFTRWKNNEGAECLVVHWYDLGGNILYDRLGMGMARMALRGRSTWPPLVKILIQNQTNAVSDEDKENQLDFSKRVFLWLHEQSRRSGELPGSPEKTAPVKSKGTTNSKSPA